MKHFLNWVTACTAIALSSVCSHIMADILIIVNSNNSMNTLSNDDAKRIFLAKKTNFDDGSKIEVVDQNDGSEIRNTFYPKVTEKTAEQARSRWAALLFSGEGQMPQAKSNDAEVINYIASTPGAIGYVSSTNNDARVKVVLTLP